MCHWAVIPHRHLVELVCIHNMAQWRAEGRRYEQPSNPLTSLWCNSILFHLGNSFLQSILAFKLVHLPMCCNLSMLTCCFIIWEQVTWGSPVVCMHASMRECVCVFLFSTMHPHLAKPLCMNKKTTVWVKNRISAMHKKIHNTVVLMQNEHH